MAFSSPPKPGPKVGGAKPGAKPGTKPAAKSGPYGSRGPGMRSGGQFVSRSKRIRGKLPQFQDENRVNERIRVPKVRLIDDVGGQVGIVDTREALRMAKEKGLDLMEVSPNSRPPVCKIVDYGKYKYEKKKKEAQARKKQTIIKVKEIQIRPNTDKHDYEVKLKKAKQFLEEGDKVKVTMLFRGRQIANTEAGMNKMKQIMADTKDLATPEQRPQLDGRKMIMVLAPGAQKKKK